MNLLTDSAGDARRAWLREMQDSLMPLQSDFEKSFGFRVVLLVAVVVISINVLAPAPLPGGVTTHATV
jgi:hypothetical protein